MSRLDRGKRLDLLRSIIQERHTLTKSELMDAVTVSRMTLFRDLEILEKEGFIEDLYGSVTLSRTDYDLQKSLVTNIDEKRSIAQAAAKLVEDDDVIFMGAGTTTLEIARLITTMENRVTIITNSLPIAQMVGKYSHIHLIMLGGYFHRQTKSFFGPSARSAIDATSARIVFFGANGVDLTAGITGHFVEQTEIVQGMIRLSKVSVGVIDSSKFGKVCANRISYLDQVNMLITDQNAPFEFIEAMRVNNSPIKLA
jgi:DeoR/GlpR family transcriptional regulator of sugar metabolism